MRTIKNKVDSIVTKSNTERRLREKDSRYYIETPKCYAVKVSKSWKIYLKENDKFFAYSTTKKDAIRIMNNKEEK